MKKRIFITAGSGFIGSHLKQYFSRKYAVLCPSHRELDLVDTKAVERFLKKNPVNYVVHAAVVGGSRREEAESNELSINLRMFFNIVRCNKFFEKMIHIGSGAEYDKTRSLKRVNEEQFGLNVPSDNYGLYKYICGEYIERSSLPLVNLRVFGIFGPNENFKYRLISNLLWRVLTKKKIELTQNAYFDYIYIDDFIPLVEEFFKREVRYKSYNIGSGVRVSLLDLANKVKKISGSKKKITIKKAGLNNEYTPDVSRLKSELGRITITPLDDSINKLFLLYKNDKDMLEAR